MFGKLCNQVPYDCIAVPGHVYPLCFRCLGVYTGAFLVAIAAFTLLRRRGLPPASLFWTNMAAVAAMIVTGAHVIVVPGPWKFVVGALFGASLVMLGAPLFQVWYLGWTPRPWSRTDVAIGFALLAAAAALPLAVRAAGAAGFGPFVVAAGTGVIVLGELANLLLVGRLLRMAGRWRLWAAVALAQVLFVPEALLVIGVRR
jgi:uncharacterized membrane protein